MSDKPELMGGSVYFSFDDGPVMMESTMVDTLVDKDSHEPLKLSVGSIEKQDEDETDYVLKLVASNSGLTIHLHIGHERDAREVVDWLDAEVSKYE